jgi:hypothetical protein
MKLLVYSVMNLNTISFALVGKCQKMREKKKHTVGNKNTLQMRSRVELVQWKDIL